MWSRFYLCFSPHFTCHEIMDSFFNMSTSPSDNITENSPKIYKTIQSSHLATMVKNIMERLIIHLKYIPSKEPLYILLAEYSAKNTILFDHNSGLSWKWREFYSQWSSFHDKCSLNRCEAIWQIQAVSQCVVPLVQLHLTTLGQVLSSVCLESQFHLFN